MNIWIFPRVCVTKPGLTKADTDAGWSWRRSGGAWSLQRVEQISVPPPQTPSHRESQALFPGLKVPRCSYPGDSLTITWSQRAPDVPKLHGLSVISCPFRAFPPTLLPSHDIVTPGSPISDQSQASIEVTWSVSTNQSSASAHLAWPLGYPPLPEPYWPQSQTFN